MPVRDSVIQVNLCSNLLSLTGYGRYGGTRTTAAELAAMFAMMEENELMVAGRLLTGGCTKRTNVSFMFY